MISKYIVSKAIQYAVIDSSERELYEVSISTMLFSGLNWITLLTFGVIQKCTLGCLIFMVLYIPLRVFGGGFHLSTKVRCYCFSIVIFTVMITLYKYSLYTNIVFKALLYLSFPAIAILAPQESAKKPLQKNEKKRNKCIVIVFLLIDITTACLLSENVYAFFAFFAPILMLIQLCLGKIQFVIARIIHRKRSSMSTDGKCIQLSEQ